jgi:hypothetical protein
VSFDRSVSAERKYVLVRVHGDSDLPSSVANIEATAQDLLANPGFGLVVDIRESTNLPTASEARSIVDAISRNRSAYAVGLVFVVASTVQLGVGRMVAILGDLAGLRIHVCRTMQEAEAWLGGA